MLCWLHSNKAQEEVRVAVFSSLSQNGDLKQKAHLRQNSMSESQNLHQNNYQVLLNRSQLFDSTGFPATARRADAVTFSSESRLSCSTTATSPEHESWGATTLHEGRSPASPSGCAFGVLSGRISTTATQRPPRALSPRCAIRSQHGLEVCWSSQNDPWLRYAQQTNHFRLLLTIQWTKWRARMGFAYWI